MLAVGAGVADAARLARRAGGQSGDAAAVRALVQQQADVNAPEVDGTTALHWAVRSGDAELVGVLLRAGAKAGAANRYGMTPLLLAASNGHAADRRRAAEGRRRAPTPPGRKARRR